MTYFTFVPPNGTINLFDEEFSIDYIFTDLKIVAASIDPTPALIQIEDAYIKFGFQNLTANLTMDYQYMSDPPIAADIGEANFHLSNTTYDSVVTSYLHKYPGTGNSEFELIFSDMKINSTAEPFCAFDGISDVSSITTNIVNTVAAIIRNRVVSFVNGDENYGLDDTLSTIVNRIFGLVPMPLPIGDKGLYLDGFFYDNVWA